MSKKNSSNKRNRGNTPPPNDAFNTGDGSYNQDKANDKDQQRRDMNKNMAKTKSGTEQMDKLQREADNETHPRKPGSQSNSSDRHNNGRGGGK